MRCAGAGWVVGWGVGGGGMCLPLASARSHATRPYVEAPRAQTFGATHVGAIPMLTAVGKLESAAGRWESAVGPLRRALAQTEAAAEPRPALEVAEVCEVLGIACVHATAAPTSPMPSAREALALFERALALREGALGRHHPDVVRTRTNMALALAAIPPRVAAGAPAGGRRAPAAAAAAPSGGQLRRALEASGLDPAAMPALQRGIVTPAELQQLTAPRRRSPSRVVAAK